MDFSASVLFRFSVCSLPFQRLFSSVSAFFSRLRWLSCMIFQFFDVIFEVINLNSLLNFYSYCCSDLSKSQTGRGVFKLNLFPLRFKLTPGHCDSMVKYQP